MSNNPEMTHNSNRKVTVHNINRSPAFEDLMEMDEWESNGSPTYIKEQHLVLEKMPFDGIKQDASPTVSDYYCGPIHGVLAEDVKQFSDPTTGHLYAFWQIKNDEWHYCFCPRATFVGIMGVRASDRGRLDETDAGLAQARGCSSATVQLILIAAILIIPILVYAFSDGA